MSAEQKHAPGPWAVIETICRNERTLGVSVDGGENGFPITPLARATPQDFADARLIAAAPDLLAACQDCVEGKGDWSALMFAAIAKATGAQS
jgi:hypothetical protein